MNIIRNLGGSMLLGLKLFIGVFMWFIATYTVFLGNFSIIQKTGDKITKQQKLKGLLRPLVITGIVTILMIAMLLLGYIGESMLLVLQKIFSLF